MNKLIMLTLMTFAFALSNAQAAPDWVGEYEFDLDGQSSHLVRCSDGIKLEVRDEDKDHICTVAGYKGLYFHSELLEIRQLKLTKDMTEAQFRTEASGKLGRLIGEPKITLIPAPIINKPAPVTKRPVRVVRQRQVPVTKSPTPVVQKQPAPARKRPVRVVRQRQAPVTKQPAPVVNKQPTPVTKRPGRVVRQRQAPVTKSPAPVVNKQPTPVTKRPVRVVRQRQAPVTRKPAPVVNKQHTPRKRPVRVQSQKIGRAHV